MATCSALIVWGHLIRIRLSRYLVRAGTPTLGRVIKKEGLWDLYGTVRLTYIYKTHTGTELEGIVHLRKDFDLYTLEMGQNVTVLYDPARPEMSTVYGCVCFEVVGLK